MRYTRSCLQIMLVVAIIVAVGYQKVYGRGGRIPTWDLVLQGTASGGSLVLAKNRNRTVK